jgi:phosphohistidine phosphatase
MPEQLLLVRHAKAEVDHLLGDDARALTPKGRAAFRLHAQALARLTPLRGVLTSPLVRAVQTAEILCEAMGIAEVAVRRELIPEAAPARLLSLLHDLEDGWAVVGHGPSLPAAAAQALRLKELPFTFKKGGALCLVRSAETFAYAWFSAPGKSVLRVLPVAGD